MADARKAASQHRAQMARRGLLALERQAEQLRAKQQMENNQSEDAISGQKSAMASPSLAVQKDREASSTQSPASKLSERIRSDVFGLKRAIRQSFRETRR